MIHAQYLCYSTTDLQTAAGNEAEGITVANILMTTNGVIHTPSAVPPVQVSETDSQASQTAWIVAAITFLAIAIVSVITLGCTLYRQMKAKKAIIVVDIPSSTESIKLKNEGMFNG